MSNNIISKIDVLTYGFAKYISVDFMAVTGIVNKKGRMTTSRTTVTSRENKKVSKKSSEGFLGSISNGSSTTSTSVYNQISLLKIGNQSFESVSISSAGFFDSIKVGDIIVAVFDKHGRSLYYINDLSDGSSIGNKPLSYWQDSLWIFLTLLFLTLPTFFIAIFNSINDLTFPSPVPIAFTLIALYLFRAMQVAKKISNKNWENAVNIPTC